MRILSVISINFKKLKFRTGKALFLILPVMLLVALVVVVSSQTNNIQLALNQYVIDKIKDESTVLEVNYQIDQTNFTNSGNRNRNSIAIQNGFTDNDLAKMRTINNVVNASINYSLPITNISTLDLFDNKVIKFREISALNEDMAGIYTSENFTFTEGEAVPIIVNPNTFIETYEDWQGKDSISIDFKTLRNINPQENPQAAMEQNTPIKTKAIEYNKEDLIDKIFTIKFGGFSDINDYEITREAGVTYFNKLTSDEIATALAEREAAVNVYWDYNKLAEGLTYTFKIVGMIEKEGNVSMYVPESFAKYVVEQYIDKQLAARNGTDIPTEVLNSTYTGLTFDGTEIVANNRMGGFMMGFGPASPNTQMRGEQSTDSYEIPGLVIKVAEANSSTIEGIYTDVKVFDTSAKRGDTITLKVNSIFNRSDVIKTLNQLGYAYQDINNLDMLNQLQNTLNQISIGVIISFIILISAVIILTMSKFVSESIKEIGIFRAVGFTKLNILTIYMVQSILYTFVGYVLGFILGLLANLLAAGAVSQWFDNFVTKIINKNLNIVSEIDNTLFNNVNIESILILTGILIIITLIISFIPALRASNISPVEAIKSE